jgi:hypothetical protein
VLVLVLLLLLLLLLLLSREASRQRRATIGPAQWPTNTVASQNVVVSPSP